MAQPTSKTQFKEFCLRKLGKPVIEINVDDDQVDDRIDEALSYYQDYHFDGVEKTYVKYQVTNSSVTVADSIELDPDNNPHFKVGDVIKEVSNGDSGSTVGTAFATIVALDNTAGKKRLFFKKPTSGTFNVGSYVTSDTFMTKVDSTTSGSATAITSIHQGAFELEYIPVPENIIGAVNVFTPNSTTSIGSGIFNAKYHFVLQNLHNIVNSELLNFQMAMSHLQLMEELLVGKVPMRYNRHQDRIMLDMDWDTLSVGEYIVIEAYGVVDPNTYSDVWKDRFLQNYATAKIKYQWGSNLTKFNGMTLPGGVQFNGEQILSDAREEIQRLEEEMSNSYSLPSVDMIG
ncbi:hypothetical protein N8464_00880 [bacterium]|nr:hypothetical protein [bacterium]